MKKYVFLAFFALIAFVVKAQDESGDLVKEGQQMPAFTIMNDNGTQVPSSSLKGKVILVNFLQPGVLLVRRSLQRCKRCSGRSIRTTKISSCW